MIPNVISGYHFGDVWGELVDDIVTNGVLVSPRELKTKELTNVTIHVEDGLNNIFYNKIRDLNYRFLIAEWLWIMCGSDDLDTIAKYNDNMRQFSDNGKTLSGAYGPKLGYQWDYIKSCLEKDASRQAVSVIWKPSPPNSKDIPCTLTLQWLIREGKLNCTINMRSSDVWLGLPYDFFTFSQMTNVISAWFGIPMGSITMNLASSHMYDTHWEKAKKILNSWDVERISSPALPKESAFPSKIGVYHILKQEPPGYAGLAPIWQQYALALTKNRNHALKILCDIGKVHE
jgi:thymidylate synthase